MRQWHVAANVYAPPMTYVLHYAPDNASMIIRLALEELGAPYKTMLVDRATRAQDGAAYRRINPAGLIPALETPDGPIFEAAAILLWLADRHGAMAPTADSPDRAPFLRTLFFVSNTLHAQMRMTFYPWKYVGDDTTAQAALRRTLQARSTNDMTLPAGLTLLDAALAASNANAPSVLHCYAVALVRWCALYPAGHTDWFDLHDYPTLLGVAQQFETRPSAHVAQAAEGLGPTPFTAPRLPTPPEGTAL